MKKNRALVAAVLGACFLTGLLVARFLKNSPTPQSGGSSSVANNSAASESVQATTPLTTSVATSGVSKLVANIESVLANLERGDASGLGQLAAALRAAKASDAIAAIREFLASGRDAKTGLVFQVGENGALDGAPSLRVFLLDQLGQIARGTSSSAAEDVSREILQSKNSADEWALALRNIGWAQPNATAFLAGKLREMLVYPAWLNQPSNGFLESFDVAVFTKDPSFVTPLSDMLEGRNPPLQRAAAVALDRLAETAPLAVMNYLNANPGTLADKPFLRADYFAKADFSDAAQRQSVESYLTRTDVSAEEKAKLITELAEPGSFVSDGLLTAATRPEPGAKQNAALQQTVKQWLEAKRFPQLQDSLLELQQQLAH